MAGWLAGGIAYSVLPEELSYHPCLRKHESPLINHQSLAWNLLSADAAPDEHAAGSDVLQAAAETGQLVVHRCASCTIYRQGGDSNQSEALVVTPPPVAYAIGLHRGASRQVRDPNRTSVCCLGHMCQSRARYR